VRGLKVLKAVSSSVRLLILNLLFDRGSLSYTELMNSLKMNPGSDAGRFAYHLKFLLKADLIEVDVETRKYSLTELGKEVIDVADRIEKKALKPKGMLVRASRLALEEFDANKIAVSLMKEAKMSAELAQRVAKEAEKRLLKSRTKYVTAPLVREIVNVILIEKGLEEYRHKLTRLGLPVHEVTALIEAKGKTSERPMSVLETAGAAVLKEYVLLKAFPRDISDAHLSGSLHISDLGQWILKPGEIVHDLRFFYQNGPSPRKTSVCEPLHSAPQNLESVLSATFNVLLHSTKEISETQTLDYFNIFLAPFSRGMEPARIKETLRLFMCNIGQFLDVSLGLELAVPDFIADRPAVGPLGKPIGKYGDFCEETQLLASLILEMFIEKSQSKPLLEPKIVVKIRSETFSNDRAKALLLKAHRLASERGTVYFANLLEKSQRQSVFSAYGHKYRSDLNGDWEIDTLRVGCLGTVAINLPRIASECEKDRTKFFDLLKERLEMAARALEIKYNALKRHGAELLPFLLQDVNGDQYFRLENSLRLINLVGLKETTEALFGKSMHEDEKALKFLEEMVQCVSDFTSKAIKRHGRRLLAAMLPDAEAAERLAQMDIDKYGVGKVKFSGTKERPFYSIITRSALQDGQVSSESSAVEQKLNGLRVGGGLTVIELGDVTFTPDELMSVTRQLVGDCKDFFTYDRKLTYCANCKRSWFGALHKCPSCNAVGNLSIYDRFALS
jgi:ribonucleoside-triphosphate reductase